MYIDLHPRTHCLEVGCRDTSAIDCSIGIARKIVKSRKFVLKLGRTLLPAPANHCPLMSLHYTPPLLQKQLIRTIPRSIARTVQFKRNCRLSIILLSQA